VLPHLSRTLIYIYIYICRPQEKKEGERDRKRERAPDFYATNEKQPNRKVPNMEINALSTNLVLGIENKKE